MEWIQVHGASMAPFLASGDSVAVEWWPEDRVDHSSFAAGQIVIARGVEGEWLVHRLVGSRRLQLKGDASPVADNASEPEIWGKVVAVRSRGRTKPWQPGALDRGIAFFSALRLSGRFFSPVSRAGVECLGRLRRVLS